VAAKKRPDARSGKRTTSKSKTSASKGSRPGKGAAESARSSARSTVSGPSRIVGSARASDAAEAKRLGTEAIASAFPFNAAKPSEFGDASGEPARGQALEPADPIVGASTLSEANASVKVGSGNPQISFNPGNGPLDRVRVDSGGRALTTNQGMVLLDSPEVAWRNASALIVRSVMEYRSPWTGAMECCH
jgi:hypothetical protein